MDNYSTLRAKKKDSTMKKTILFLFIVSSTFAFELNFDTINAGVYQPLYVAGEHKTLYVNSGNDTIRFDSARVDLVKSENNQCEIEIECGFKGDPTRNNKVFYFSTYGEYGGGIQDSLNIFRLEVRPGDTVSTTVWSFDYRLFGIIPENPPGLKDLTPPQPMQAKMTFFTNKGSDSIIINGMQTNQPAPNAITNRRLPVTGGATIRQTEYYTISGKRINLSSPKKTTLSKGIGIAVEKYPDGSVSCKKSLLTR